MTSSQVLTCVCRGMSHVCHMTHTYHVTHAIPWLVDVYVLRSYVCHDSFICVPWFIHVCAMTHSYVCAVVWVMCVTWLIHIMKHITQEVSVHVCHMTHTYYVTHHSWSECACVSHDSYILCHTSLKKWASHITHVTHHSRSECHTSPMTLSWYIHQTLMTHYVTHHSLHITLSPWVREYHVATVSRIDRIIGLFCRILALL